MPDRQLSEHFKESEFRCKCGCGKFIHNPRLVMILEFARHQYGKPIIIVSGTRCEAHNRAVGGKATSAHLTGEAVDIRIDTSSDRFALLKIFYMLGIKRFGIGGGFLHIDVSEALPQGVTWLYQS